MNPSAVGDS